MHVPLGQSRQRGLKRLRHELARCRIDAENPVAAAEKFDRAGFIHQDVGVAMRQNDASGTGICRQRQGIGDRAARNKEDSNFVLEDVTETFGDTCRQLVSAIGRATMSGGLGKRRNDIVRNAGPIIAGEDHDSHAPDVTAAGQTGSRPISSPQAGATPKFGTPGFILVAT